jgi:hypothetical protein
VESATDTQVVERELTIAASPETVWDFLVDPDKATRWMGEAASFEARPGGLYRVDVSRVTPRPARSSSSTRRAGSSTRGAGSPAKKDRTRFRRARARSRSSSAPKATGHTSASSTGIFRARRRPLRMPTAGTTTSGVWRSPPRDAIPEGIPGSTGRCNALGGGRLLEERRHRARGARDHDHCPHLEHDVDRAARGRDGVPQLRGDGQ